MKADKNKLNTIRISLNKLKSKLTVSNIVICISIIVLIIYAVSLILPLIWLFFASLKNDIEYTLSTFSFPEVLRFSNYIKVWQALKITTYTNGKIVTFDIWSMLFHTVVLNFFSNVKNILGSMLVAYIFAKYKCKFTSIMFSISIVLMIIPFGPSLVVSLRFAKWLGYHDNFLFYCLWGAGCFGGNFLLLYAAFKGLAWDYGESAFLDGAGHGKVLFRIYVPMVFPMLATLFILGMISSFSDYMTTVIWLPSFPTFGYGIFMFRSYAQHYGYGTPIILAGYVITGVFSMILYLVFQNLIISKFTVGTLKQ